MSLPRFSVVIPTYRREDLLTRCLESLRPGVQRADAASYEIIVTDDAQNNTCEAMLRTQFPWARWVQGPSRGPAANRNNGARHAAGEWICFIDDDCTADPDWLTALEQEAGDGAIGLIEGRTVVPVWIDSPFQHAIFNEGGNFWSCNLAVRRELLLSLGGFDEDFLEAAGEDMEFAYRYHARKNRSLYCPKAIVYHPARPIGWRGVWKKLFMIRWTALYEYKIDQSLHLSDSAARNQWRAFTGMIMHELRVAWQDVRSFRPTYWKERSFWLVLRWLTLPLTLPYYLYWVGKFHAQLLAEKKPAG